VSRYLSKHWRASIFAYAPLILWIAVIFFLSSEQGSMVQTSRFIRPLLRFLFSAASEETIQLYHAYIRKAAHVTEYAVLAAIAFRTLRLSSVVKSTRYSYLLPVGLVTLIASIDEFNQSFEPSRTSSPYDVLLDIAGGLTGLAVIWLFFRLRRPAK
jgi:VanZ family protein